MEEGDTEIFPTGLGVSYAVDCNPKMQIDEPPLDPTDPAYSDESEKARDKGYTLFCSLPGRELSGKKGWTKIIANFHTSRLVYQNWQWQRRAVIIPVTIWIYVVPENK
jgi:hypothetical protein